MADVVVFIVDSARGVCVTVVVSAAIAICIGGEEAFEQWSHNRYAGACYHEGGFEDGEDVGWNGGVGKVVDVDLKE